MPSSETEGTLFFLFFEALLRLPSEQRCRRGKKEDDYLCRPLVTTCFYATATGVGAVLILNLFPQTRI